MCILVQERPTNRARECSCTSYNGNPADILGEALPHFIHVEYSQKCWVRTYYTGTIRSAVYRTESVKGIPANGIIRQRFLR